MIYNNIYKSARKVIIKSNSSPLYLIRPPRLWLPQSDHTKFVHPLFLDDLDQIFQCRLIRTYWYNSVQCHSRSCNNMLRRYLGRKMPYQDVSTTMTSEYKEMSENEHNIMKLSRYSGGKVMDVLTIPKIFSEIAILLLWHSIAAS